MAMIGWQVKMGVPIGCVMFAMLIKHLDGNVKFCVCVCVCVCVAIQGRCPGRNKFGNFLVYT